MSRCWKSDSVPYSCHKRARIKTTERKGSFESEGRLGVTEGVLFLPPCLASGTLSEFMWLRHFSQGGVGWSPAGQPQGSSTRAGPARPGFGAHWRTYKLLETELRPKPRGRGRKMGRKHWARFARGVVPNEPVLIGVERRVHGSVGRYHRLAVTAR